MKNISKDDYLLRNISKIKHKKWELYIITRILHSLNDSEISNDDFIFIFSNTFEDKIKRKLLNKGFNEKNIFSLSNLFDIEYT